MLHCGDLSLRLLRADVEGERTASSEQLGQDNKEQGDSGGDNTGLQVECVHLVANSLREIGVLDLLEAGAVDVPNATLRYVS